MAEKCMVLRVRAALCVLSLLCGGGWLAYADHTYWGTVSGVRTASGTISESDLYDSSLLTDGTSWVGGTVFYNYVDGYVFTAAADGVCKVTSWWTDYPKGNGAVTIDIVGDGINNTWDARTHLFDKGTMTITVFKGQEYAIKVSSVAPWGQSYSFSVSLPGGGSTPDPSPTPPPSPTPTKKPDLKFYKPDGWSAAAIVATSPSATASGTTFKDNDTIYVNFAAVCRDASISTSFKTVLYVDGVRTKSWTTDFLSKDYYTHPKTDSMSIGTLSVGTHKLRLVVDGEYDVSESDEGNNVYEKTITVESSILTVKPNSSKYGSVSVSGTVAYGQRVYLSATPKSGYVFTGWYLDKDCTVKLYSDWYDYRESWIGYTVPYSRTTVYAKFNLKSTDKSALKFSSSTSKLATTPKASKVNAPVSLSLGFSSKSYPTVTATGLPAGLAIDSLTGKITGSVKKPGAYTVKVKVKNAAGNAISQDVKINIKAPSWSTGTFYGYGAVVANGKTVPVSVKFTASEVGKVSGKVVYKGRNAPFTANYASATDAEARFTVKFSIGGVEYKSAMSIKQKTSGLTYTRAHALGDLFELEMQKKVPLVQTGKSLAGMIGKSYTFTKDYKNAGLKKSGDKLVAKFCEQDTVKLSGIVNGTKFSGLSVAAMACGKSKTETTTKYKLNVPVVEPTTKYSRLLTFKVTIDTKTKKVTKVEKAFAAIE